MLIKSFILLLTFGPIQLLTDKPASTSINPKGKLPLPDFLPSDLSFPAWEPPYITITNTL
jgi:hypothetical protein